MRRGLTVVVLKQNYRYWVIWRRPTVRFLDYVKVKDSERLQAKALFGTWDEPTELASKVCVFDGWWIFGWM